MSDYDPIAVLGHFKVHEDRGYVEQETIVHEDDLGPIMGLLMILEKLHLCVDASCCKLLASAPEKDTGEWIVTVWTKQ